MDDRKVNNEDGERWERTNSGEGLERRRRE